MPGGTWFAHQRRQPDAEVHVVAVAQLPRHPLTMRSRFSAAEAAPDEDAPGFDTVVMSFLAPQPHAVRVFNIRARSLLRGKRAGGRQRCPGAGLGRLSNVHASLLLLVPVFLAAYGTWETSRCLRPRWSFYHGGVLLLLYADVLALALIVFPASLPLRTLAAGAVREASSSSIQRDNRAAG